MDAFINLTIKLTPSKTRGFERTHYRRSLIHILILLSSYRSHSDLFPSLLTPLLQVPIEKSPFIIKTSAPENSSSWTNLVPPDDVLLGSNRKEWLPTKIPGIPPPLLNSLELFSCVNAYSVSDETIDEELKVR